LPRRLSSWDGGKTVVGKSHPVAHPVAEKQQAVIALNTRKGTGLEVAKSVGVSRTTLYNWSIQLLGQTPPISMSTNKSWLPVAERDALSKEVEQLEARMRKHIPAGKVYLSPIIDCFDGLVVSWTIGTRPDGQLVNTMLDQAIETLQPGEHPIIHSDQGAHYRWPQWISRTRKAKLTRSMSKKGKRPPFTVLS